MKKLSLAAVVLFAAHASFAQNFFAGVLGRMAFGLGAGGNYGNFTNAGFDTKGLAGFHASGIMNYRMSDHFSIQEDILYSTQGAQLKDNSVFAGKDIKLSYLSIPLLVRYSNRADFFIETGP